MRIAVLGGGLVGGAMARDLAAEGKYSVRVADLAPDALAKVKAQAPLEVVQADLSDPKRVRDVVSDVDFVVSAVPGSIGFQTLKAVIEAGRDVVDIAFFPEDPFDLDDLAKTKGVTAIVDCGVMPGMGSILTAYASAQLDETHDATILVGGLPAKREWPWEYKAVFSPSDVIEEYLRPARYIESGQLVTRPALSDPEYIEFPEVGTLEAFNTDGLRTMLKTIPATNMKEKTLRYPGHIEKIAVLRASGFFSTEKIAIDGALISPLAFTSRVLFPNWKLPKGEADLTLMRITVHGVKDGKRRSFRYDLHDRYDAVNDVFSMSRATGYTATAALRMLTQGLYSRKGISAPEFFGSHPECVGFLLACLEERGVHYDSRIS